MLSVLQVEFGEVITNNLRIGIVSIVIRTSSTVLIAPADRLLCRASWLSGVVVIFCIKVLFEICDPAVYSLLCLEESFLDIVTNLW